MNPATAALPIRADAVATLPDDAVWAIVAKGGIEHVRHEAMRLHGHLVNRGVKVLLESGLHPDGHNMAELDELADVFLTVGGDGTILHAMQGTQKPVLAVNAGAVGFLAEVEPRHARMAIDRVLAGEFEVQERDRLAVELDGVHLGDAVNEVTLQSSRTAKLIQFTVTVDGEVLDILRGDGIIVSTPTGSTGYAMSVGGPLVHPRVRGTVLAPIAPFRLAARPWVIPESSDVELTVMERDSSTDPEPARIVMDGQREHPVRPGDAITITRSERTARFVRLSRGYYERVRRKLVR